MTEQETPLYVSLKCARSLWQEYRVFTDRIEIDTLFNTIVVKKEQIVSISIYHPPVFRTSLSALKIDMADLFKHIGITRKNGIFKDLRFTPDDPDAFIKATKSAMNI